MEGANGFSADWSGVVGANRARGDDQAITNGSICFVLS